jgi:hypothetical protein
MKRLDGRCSDLFHCVQQPQLRGIPRSHRRPVPGVCRLPSTAATDALSPMLGQTYRAPRAMSVAGDSGERWQPLFRHLLDPKPKSHKAISPVAPHLVVIKNVGNSKFVGKGKNCLQQGLLAPDRSARRCRRRESLQDSRGRFLHAAIELAHRDIQQLRRLGFRDRTLSECSVAESIQTSRPFLGQLVRLVVWSAPVSQPGKFPEEPLRQNGRNIPRSPQRYVMA